MNYNWLIQGLHNSGLFGLLPNSSLSLYLKCVFLCQEAFMFCLPTHLPIPHPVLVLSSNTTYTLFVLRKPQCLVNDYGRSCFFWAETCHVYLFFVRKSSCSICSRALSFDRTVLSLFMSSFFLGKPQCLVNDYGRSCFF